MLNQFNRGGVVPVNTIVPGNNKLIIQWLNVNRRINVKCMTLVKWLTRIHVELVFWPLTANSNKGKEKRGIGEGG